MTPYIDRITRILEGLEQGEAREACPVPATPIPLPHGEHTTRPATRHGVPVTLVRACNTLHRYFQHTDSPPSSEASYTTQRDTSGVVAAHGIAQSAHQDTPPTEDGLPRKWFHTAAGEWIDLAKLDPVDWDVACTNLANSVAHLQTPCRKGHTARSDLNDTARPQLEPPADVFLASDHADPGVDTAWYTTEDRMTSGDSRVLDYVPPSSTTPRVA